MENPCIKKHLPKLNIRYNELRKQKLSDRDAAIKAVTEEHQKIFKELQDFKKELKLPIDTYAPYDTKKTESDRKEINDRYNTLIEDKKKGSEGEFPIVTKENPNENPDAEQNKKDEIPNPEKKGDTTNEPPNKISETTEGGKEDGKGALTKKAFKNEYGFEKVFPSQSDQAVGDKAMSEVAETATKKGLTVEQQVENEVAQMGNKDSYNEHDLMVAGYHLRTLDERISIANNSGEDATHLQVQREKVLTTLRKMSNTTGRMLRLFGSIYKKSESGKLEITRANLRKNLGIPEIPKSMNELKLSKLSEEEKKKVEPYVKAIEELNKTLADIKTKVDKGTTDINNQEVKDYIDAEIKRRLAEKPNTPKARQKQSQSLRDLAQRIRTQNELDKFKDLGRQGGTAFNKSSIFGDFDFKEAAAQAIDYVAKGLEAGEDLAVLIKKASLRFKDKFDHTEFEKAINVIVAKSSLPNKNEVIDKIKEMASNEGAKTITPDMVKHGLIKDIVNDYIHSETPSNEVIKEATKELKKHLPDITEGEVQDALLKRGDYKESTKIKLGKDISEKKNEVKKLSTRASNIREVGNGVREEPAKGEIKIAKDAEDFINEIKNDNTLTDETKKEHIKAVEAQRDEALKNTRQGVLTNLKEAIDTHVKELEGKINDAIAAGEKESSKNIKEVKRDLQDLSDKLSPNKENLKDQIDKADQDLQAIIKSNKGNEFEENLKGIQDEYHKDWQKTADEIQQQGLLSKAIKSKEESERRLAAGQYTEIPTTPYDVKRNVALAQAEAESKKAWAQLNSMASKAKEQRENKGGLATWLSVRRQWLIMTPGAIEKVGLSGVTKPIIDPLIKQTFGRAAGIITGVTPSGEVWSKKGFARIFNSYRQMKNEAVANDFMRKMNNEYVDAIISNEKILKEFGADSKEAKNSKSVLNEAELSHQASLGYLFMNANSGIDIAQVMIKGATDLDARIGKYAQSKYAERSKKEEVAFWIEGINRTHSAMKSVSYRQATLDSYMENLQYTQKKEGQITNESRQKAWDYAVLQGEEGRFGESTKLSRWIGKAKSSESAAAKNVANYLLPVAKISINITKQGLDMALPMVEAGWATIKNGAYGIKLNSAEGKEYSSFISKYADGVKKGFNELPYEQKKYINTLITRGLFGMAQYAFVGYFLSQGNIKYGGAYDPNDPFQKHKVMGSDGQPLKHGEWEFFGKRAPKVLNLVINHSPYSLPTSMAAVSYEQYQTVEKSPKLRRAITKDLNEVYERLPFVTAVDVAKAAFGDDYKLQNIVANELPTMKGTAEYFDKGADGEKRAVEIKSNTFMGTIGNIWKSKLPYFRNTLPDKKVSGEFSILNPSKASKRDATPKEVQDYKDLYEQKVKQKIKDNLKEDSKVMLTMYGDPTISYKAAGSKTKLYKQLTPEEKTKLKTSYKDQAATEAKNKLFGEGNW